MLDGIKRWLSGASGAGTAGYEAIVDWANNSQRTFRGVQDEGFVIDGRLGGSAWRLEWGPTQRPYFSGHELRLRADTGVESELQLLVLSRELQEQLEKTIFEQYVEDVQTRIDNQTPPEMRWLVMFPKLPGSEMGALKEQFVAVGNSKPWLQAWLRGALSQALALRATQSAAPLVLMIGRGRLMLRTTLEDPTVLEIQRAVSLFESALREARRVASESPRGQPDSGLPASGGSDWDAATSRLTPEAVDSRVGAEGPGVPDMGAFPTGPAGLADSTKGSAKD